MTAYVTQQVAIVGYKTDPQGRVTSMALEVIRSTASTGLVAGTVQPVVVVVAS